MKSDPLTEDEAYDLLNQSHNPPTFNEKYTEEEFKNEWHHVRKEMDALLSQFGKNDVYGEADYNLGEILTLSRGIGIELTSTKLLNKKLIPKTQELLRTIKVEYEIDFAVLTEKGVFHIFVKRDRVRYWCPKRVKAKLGI